ncbi:hypothetical protein CALCODRAFT_480504 [Calocera cornea HHB12733]|uniref:Uncharacterized protein n=1 Tax=Calocera cornea HHB12733 TaxID=1353952 RepID=A0A165IHW8_9BASI|nr:hypothetical protein CALCODRAFT_480504 [Calocera cornea HHB12733]
MASTMNGAADDRDDQSLPEFGHPMLSQFFFRPGLVNLNHGSHGSLPGPSPQRARRSASCPKSSRSPDKFVRFTSRRLLAGVRAPLAPLLGADVDELVLVPNATHAVSPVFLNVDWRAGDVIVVWGRAPVLLVVVLLKESSLLHLRAEHARGARDAGPDGLRPGAGLVIHRIPTSLPTSHAGFRASLAALPRHAGQ